MARAGSRRRALGVEAAQIEAPSAFAGQTSRTTRYTFGLVLFPVLIFLGLTTFERLLQTSIDDTIYLRRMNRLRRFYVEAAPGLASYLSLPAAGDKVEDILRLGGSGRGHGSSCSARPEPSASSTARSSV